jgi:transposase
MIPRSRKRPSRPQATGSRTEPTTQLTDDQWFLIEDLFPDPEMSSLGGRPPRKNRDCFEGILFVLIAGCRWKDLPARFPSKSVCHARFKQWTEEGRFQIAWQRLLHLKQMLGQLDLSTLLGDGTFVPAKKGAAA